jgi:hypothetical protein
MQKILQKIIKKIIQKILQKIIQKIMQKIMQSMILTLHTPPTATSPTSDCDSYYPSLLAGAL